MVVSTPFYDSSLRKEIEEYIKACEQLLSSTTNLSYIPLSLTEREVMEYYAEELQKRLLIPQPAK